MLTDAATRVTETDGLFEQYAQQPYDSARGAHVNAAVGMFLAALADWARTKNWQTWWDRAVAGLERLAQITTRARIEGTTTSPYTPTDPTGTEPFRHDFDDALWNEINLNSPGGRE